MYMTWVIVLQLNLFAMSISGAYFLCLHFVVMLVLEYMKKRIPNCKGIFVSPYVLKFIYALAVFVSAYILAFMFLDF